MYKTFFITTLLSVIFIGCGSKALLQSSYKVQKQEKRAKSLQPRVYKNARFEYRIAPHDRLQITVYNHPELSTRSTSTAGILVDSGGRIHLPLIGSVQISGLTQPRAATRLQSRYAHYLKKSNVHLEVLNKKAYIVGEVKIPGVIELPNEQTTLLQAVSSARGFTDYANKEKIVIMRSRSGGTRVEIVDLTSPSSLSHANMMIRPNDIIYVTPSSMKDIAISIMPLFKLASDALLPFIRYQDLTN